VAKALPIGFGGAVQGGAPVVASAHGIGKLCGNLGAGVRPFKLSVIRPLECIPGAVFSESYTRSRPAGKKEGS
jgi:hypothetical protein